MKCCCNYFSFHSSQQKEERQHHPKNAEEGSTTQKEERKSSTTQKRWGEGVSETPPPKREEDEQATPPTREREEKATHLPKGARVPPLDITWLYLTLLYFICFSSRNFTLSGRTTQDSSSTPTPPPKRREERQHQHNQKKRRPTKKTTQKGERENALPPKRTRIHESSTTHEGTGAPPKTRMGQQHRQNKGWQRTTKVKEEGRPLWPSTVPHVSLLYPYLILWQFRSR